ncbi:24152_t:CDS:1, partial [Cetraspora pellucida]
YSCDYRNEQADKLAKASCFIEVNSSKIIEHKTTILDYFNIIKN